MHLEIYKSILYMCISARKSEHTVIIIANSIYLTYLLVFHELSFHLIGIFKLNHKL